MKYLHKYKLFESDEEDIQMEIKDILCELVDYDFVINVSHVRKYYSSYKKITTKPDIVISIHKDNFKNFKWDDNLSNEILVNLKSHLSDRYIISVVRGTVEIIQHGVITGHKDYIIDEQRFFQRKTKAPMASLNFVEIDVELVKIDAKGW